MIGFFGGNEREILLGLAIIKKRKGDIEKYKHLITSKSKERMLEMLCKREEQQLLAEYEESIYDEINNELFEGRSKGICEIVKYLSELYDEKKVLSAFSGRGTIDLNLFKDNPKIKLCGLDISKDALEIARIKAEIFNYTANYKEKNIFTDSIEDKNFDLIICDPPAINGVFRRSFGNKSDELFIKNCDRYGIDIKNTKRVSALWVSVVNLLESLSDGSKMIILASNSGMYQESDIDLRKFFVDNKYIESIYCLPEVERIYKYIIVLNNGRNNEKINFIDLRETLIEINRRKKEIDIEKAKSIIDKKGLEVSIEEIKENDYILIMTDYSEKIEIKNGIALGDVTTKIARGYSSLIDDENDENDENETYKLLEASSIGINGDISDELEKITANKNKVDKHLLEDGDVVISARGIIKETIVNISDGEKIIPSGNLTVVRVDKSKINPFYLKMFLDSEKGEKSIEKLSRGTVIPIVNIKDLGKMIVPCPSLEEQNKIVKKYKDKMEMINSARKILNSLNDELQEIANSI